MACEAVGLAAPVAAAAYLGGCSKSLDVALLSQADLRVHLQGWLVVHADAATWPLNNNHQLVAAVAAA